MKVHEGVVVYYHMYFGSRMVQNYSLQKSYEIIWNSWINMESVIIFSQKVMQKNNVTLRKKCPHSEFFWSVFFPTFGLNTERFRVSLSIQPECGKIRTRKTPNTDIFYAVWVCLNAESTDAEAFYELERLLPKLRDGNWINAFCEWLQLRCLNL